MLSLCHRLQSHSKNQKKVTKIETTSQKTEGGLRMRCATLGYLRPPSWRAPVAALCALR